jgi:hypothetical protein
MQRNKKMNSPSLPFPELSRRAALKTAAFTAAGATAAPPVPHGRR